MLGGIHICPFDQSYTSVDMIAYGSVVYFGTFK